MVPFYGQGLNCGLEDVRVLVSTILSTGVDLSLPASENKTGPERSGHSTVDGMEAVLEQYTRSRHADLVAICDLAMQN